MRDGRRVAKQSSLWIPMTRCHACDALMQIKLKSVECLDMHSAPSALQRMAHFEFLERIRDGFPSIARRGYMTEDQLEALTELIDTNPYFRKVSKLAQHQQAYLRRAVGVCTSSSQRYGVVPISASLYLSILVMQLAHV